MNKTERPRINNSLNILKCISAFAVVCIHCFVIENGVSSNQLVDGLARFAVPVFFLISGFYSYYADNTKATQKYIVFYEF